MGFEYLWIFAVISLVICVIGFYKYVYFLSVGYGLSVAGIGIAMIVMMLMGHFAPTNWHYFALSALSPHWS